MATSTFLALTPAGFAIAAACLLNAYGVTQYQADYNEAWGYDTRYLLPSGAWRTFDPCTTGVAALKRLKQVLRDDRRYNILPAV